MTRTVKRATLALVPALNWLFRAVVAERAGTILLSALVSHTAWHWMTDRASTLREYQFIWPQFDLSLAASAARGLILVLVLAAALWLMLGLFRRLNAAARN